MSQEILLTPPGRAPFVFLGVVITGFCVFMGWLHFNQPAAPTAASMAWPAVGWAAAITVALLGPMIWAVRRRSLALIGDNLVFRGGLYRKVVPISHLRVAAAQEFSLFERTEFAPRWRTNAIGLPGFRVGWFRLRNGERALAYLTDPFHVTYLPTTDGFVLLLSTSKLLDALQRAESTAT